MKDTIKSKLHSTLSSRALAEYVSKQFYHFFPDESVPVQEIFPLVLSALERVHYCFSKINLPYFNKESVTYFNHLHGDQYAMFLYFLSNEAYTSSNYNVYIKSSLLNKALHSLDLFGHVAMPNIFLLVHPVGTVIGRASFEEQLVIYQNVTIGGKHSSKAISYPKLDRNVIIYSNSSIIGNCDVGENVIIGAQALIVDKIVPSNSIVLGQHPKCRVLTNQANNNFFF